MFYLEVWLSVVKQQHLLFWNIFPSRMWGLRAELCRFHHMTKEARSAVLWRPLSFSQTVHLAVYSQRAQSTETLPDRLYGRNQNSGDG